MPYFKDHTLLKAVEGVRKWLSQFYKYQYIEIGPSLAARWVIALF